MRTEKLEHKLDIWKDMEKYERMTHDALQLLQLLAVTTDKTLHQNKI